MKFFAFVLVFAFAANAHAAALPGIVANLTAILAEGVEDAKELAGTDLNNFHINHFVTDWQAPGK